MIDIIEYLENRNIRYWTSGKNVTHGWINIQCVFESCDDTSNHLGINLESGNCSCWKCGGKGNLTKLIQLIEHCNYYEATKIIQELAWSKKATPREIDRDWPTQSIALPKEATIEFPEPHNTYLTRRGFDPDELRQRYRLRACYLKGRYRFRVIIPIIVNDLIVSFQGLDVTGQSPQHYRNASNQYAAVEGGRLLYNVDNINHTAVLVEGVTDVWRIGFGAIALLGSRITEGKIKLLRRMNLDRLYIMYDNDAIERGKKAAQTLAKIVKKVEYIEIPESDPDDYFRKNPKELAELRDLLK
jgi:DNA primase